MRRAIGIQAAADDTSIGNSRKLLQPESGKRDYEKVSAMLYTIAVVLIILWLLGLVTSTTMGGLIHILLVIAIIMVLLNVISGRRP
jgi:hypothetical protein